MPIVPIPLPDDIADWRGTASQLADKCNELLPNIGLADDAGTANERLVRHYVQVGVLTPPEREGREAYFGLRQIVEFLAARYLIKDGWPLAKIGELLRGSDLSALGELIPTDQPRTRAEEVVAALRSRPATRESVERFDLSSPMPAFHADASMGYQRPLRLETPVSKAAAISKRRTALRDNLTALGNERGRPERKRTVRIALTPWCQVYVDAAQLHAMAEDTPDVLGTALTQALHEERLKRGD